LRAGWPGTQPADVLSQRRSFTIQAPNLPEIIKLARYQAPAAVEGPRITSSGFFTGSSMALLRNAGQKASRAFIPEIWHAIY